MRKVLALALSCLLGVICAGVAFAQDRPIDFSSKGANIFSAPGAQSLSLPSLAAPSAVVARFLHSQGYLPETTASLVATSEGRVSRAGITHLRFTQEVEGLTVYGTYVKAAVNDDGELVHLIENLATLTAGVLLPTVIGEQGALDAALEKVHPGVSVNLIRGPRDGNTTRFSGDEFFYRDPTVTRVAIPMESGVLQEGYLVETWTEEGNLLHYTLIGGTGRVLRVELRTNNDSYNIFPDHPGNTLQTTVSGPGAGNNESPRGWLKLKNDNLTLSPQLSIDISGNNAHAYLDVNHDNAPDAPDPSIDLSIENGDFVTTAQSAQQPNTLINQEVAVQNLFYFNNVIHDKLYRHGFDEVAGNFQEYNFGNGGKESDSVNAEAQDGGGYNNANFATPADGGNPRMQMYLWNPGTHRVDITDGLTYSAAGALFGPTPIDTGVKGEVVVANDGLTGPGTPSDGCETINNVAGKIALIDRGLCDFVVKVQNAQTADAIGVIVVNNVGDSLVIMADNGDGGSIAIPSLFIGQSNGNAIKAALAVPSTVTATLKMSQLMRDGDVDSDIIWHEYGHGLTWRMIGGMSGAMSGAIGEGMSDVLAILANDQDTVGEYSTNDSSGIRSAPYTGYLRTYGNFTGSSVHYNGEIYAAIIWHLWEIFQYENNDIPQETLWNYLIDGMNYTPAGPTFEDMRDGILEGIAWSAPESGHECLIWEAFAAFGVGVDAGARKHKKFGWRITEDFDLPSDCLDGQPQPPVADAGPDQTVTDDTGDDGSELVTLDGSASYDPGGGNMLYEWSEAESPFATGVTPTVTLGLGTHTITLTVTDNDGLTDTDDLVITIQASGGGTDPIVSSCLPDEGRPGDRMTVTLDGSGFQNGATVDFGASIVVQGVTFDNSNQLSVRIKVHNRAATGPRDVTVTNPNGGYNVALGCFNVIGVF